MNSPITPCLNHRVRMVSSDEVYANKWDEKYGREPVKFVFVYRCLACGEQITNEFPNLNYKRESLTK